jgi:hypothetical protein
VDFRIFKSKSLFRIKTTRPYTREIGKRRGDRV